MTRIALIMIVALALSACATTPTEPEVRTVTAYVDRPVACVKEAERPTKPAPLGERPSALRAMLDVALAKVKEWEIFGDKADPLLARCAKAP